MTLQEPPDHHVMDAVVDGDRKALADLFDRHAPTALALARRVTRDAELAEDVVQEAFLALWVHPDRYSQDKGTVRAYLLTLVHHRAVDRVRRESAHSQRLDRATTLIRDRAPDDPETTVVEALDRDDRRTAVRAALQDLPETQREVVDLLYFGGLTQNDIAAHLGIAVGTVKSRTRLAMRKLADTLVRSDST